ncbi:MAG: OmpA family protein [Bacteroidales bacterium]|nr:OmpA family protein [Bacteroidales bacterium]
MKSLIYLFTAFTLSWILASPAEGQIWLSNEDIFDEAEEFLNANEYVEALPLYLLLEKKEVFNAHIAYKIGYCYLNIRGKKEKSVPYLELAAESVSEDFEDRFDETHAPLRSWLMLGIAYRINGDIDKAEEIFSKLKDRMAVSDPDFLAVIDMHLERCNNARMLNAFPNEPRTERLPEQINTVFSNYNPVLVDHDSLLYYMEELKFYDAVMQVRQEKGVWGTPENITPKLGSDGDHILVSASADGATLFLYYYEPPNAGEIYSSHCEEGEWTKLKALNKNINTVYHETHASISADGNTLYFTSNREGGYGGLDLYKSERAANGDWGPAENLGPKINTPFNEETPIINVDDEILYFSSQGHLSMGGYDIFYALKRDNGAWRQPINMGAPVSTTDDDLFYYPLDEHVSGLMSRIEETSNGYDIIRYNSMVFANSPRFNVRGKAEGVDSTNYDDYSLAVVNTETGDTLRRYEVSPTGEYTAVLPAGNFDLVMDNSSGIVSVRDVKLTDSSDEEVLLASALSGEGGSPEENPEGLVPMLLEEADTLYLEFLLYNFDDFKLRNEYQTYLNDIKTLLLENPELKFRIEGHTDSKGSESYNLLLSRKRSEAVLGYLIDDQVKASRFELEGKGETEPAAINTKRDGSDSPEGRTYNRRVELVPLAEVEGLVFMKVNMVPEDLRVQ